MNDNYNLDEDALHIMKTLVTALGSALAVWGAFNLMQGYEEDDQELKEHGFNMLLSGGNYVSLAARMDKPLFPDDLLVR